MNATSCNFVLWWKFPYLSLPIIFLIFPDRTPLMLMPQQRTVGIRDYIDRKSLVGIGRVSLTWVWCLRAWSMTQLRRATSTQAVSRLATAAASPTSIKGRDTSKMASIGLGWAPRQDRLKHCYKTESQVRILQNLFCRKRRRILQNKFCKTEFCKSEFCKPEFCRTSSAWQNSARQIL